MSALQSPIPAHAECLRIEDFERRHRELSKYAPPAMTLRFTLECPACATDQGAYPLNEQMTCGCGLHMWPTAAKLFVWRDEAPKVEAPALAEAEG